MGNVGTHLDVVELLLIDVMGYVLPTAVPSYFVARVTLMNVGGQSGYLVGCSIATHKANAGDAFAMLCHQAVYGIGIKGSAGVRPQIGAVTARTPTGAPRDVDGQRGFVGHLLEDNIRVDVFKHCGNSGGALPPDVLVRSCLCASDNR